jgi:hypothetical protein
MGASRAREMAPLGMRGFGRVCARFFAEEDFQDDEVALLHEPSRPYRPLTEPLVHLREALAALAREGVVAPAAAEAVVHDLKSRWYGERTIAGIVHALEGMGYPARDVRARLGDFDRFRTKTQDLERFLEERPWSEAAVSSRPPTRRAPRGP